MRILNLIENTQGAAGILSEHGLSFYIETERHKLLVDTGATDAFLRNAEKLGVDLSQVDTVVISHGHYDHAGGLLAFAERNPHARIWIQRQAGEAYYHVNVIAEQCAPASDRKKPDVRKAMGDAAPVEKYDHIPGGKKPDCCRAMSDAVLLEQYEHTPNREKPDNHKTMNDVAFAAKYIGIDPRIKQLPQIEWVDGDKRIDEELFLFGHVAGRRLWPLGNRELMLKKEDAFAQDTFQHEQYLVLEEQGKRILISGCAHNGILNILDRYREIYGTVPDAVISGFHMSRKPDYSQADLELVRQTGEELRRLPIRFYTGHCTGEVPYRILKETMGEQLSYVHSGEEIFIM